MRYWIFWFVFNVLGRLPRPILYGISDFVGWASYILYRSQRECVLANMRQVRPDASERELKSLARDVFRNVTLNYADIASLPHVDPEELLEKRLILHGIHENFMPAAASGKGVVLITCHFGNPELVLQGLVGLGVSALALTEPLDPPRLSELLDKHRSSVGLEFVPVSVGSVKQVMKRLKQGGVVALTGDRDIEGPKQRMPFMGAETFMPTGPIEVALRTGAIVIPAFCLRRRERFDAYAEPPLELERTGDMEADARRGEMLFLSASRSGCGRSRASGRCWSGCGRSRRKWEEGRRKKRPGACANMGKADLHIHTSFSDGMGSAREMLDRVEGHTDLDVIAITDHDSIAGALAAREVWARGNYRFDFVPGVEVTTIEGHLLALFVEEPVPNLCRVEVAIEAVHKQGGICVAAHPMNPLTRSLGAKELRRLARGAGSSHLDAIEAANCSPGSRWGRKNAITLNRAELGLAAVGGSDAHFPEFAGGAYTAFDGASAGELKSAILARTTTAEDGPRPAYWQIGPHRLAQQTWRGIMTTPRTMGWGPTTRSFVRRVFG